MTPTLRLNVSRSRRTRSPRRCVAGTSAQDAAAQATIRSRDLSEAWTPPPSLLPADLGDVPSWNAQPNSWRLGVAIENLDTGVVLTDVERGMPAERRASRRATSSSTSAASRSATSTARCSTWATRSAAASISNGKVDFLVFDNRNRQLQNLPVTLVQQSAGGVRGEVTCRERITLTQQAVLTVRLRDVTYPNWQNVEVGKQVIPNPKHPPIPFSIEFDRTQIYPDHKYAVDAWLVDRGQIVLQSSAPIPVTPLANTATLQVNLVKVGASVPPTTRTPSGSSTRSTSGTASTSAATRRRRNSRRGRATCKRASRRRTFRPTSWAAASTSTAWATSAIRISPSCTKRCSAGSRRRRRCSSSSTQYQQYGGARTDFVRDVLRLQP